MPIGDTPALQIIIDEALGAGIDHIVVVSSRSKPAIERLLRAIARRRRQARGVRQDRAGRPDRAASGRDWRATIVYQDNPRGLGHAVGCAREAVGDAPFAVLLPDELMGNSSLLAQMNGVCVSTGGSVVGLKQAPRHEVSSYGVIDPAGEMSPRRRDRRPRPGREAGRRGRTERSDPDRPIRAHARRVRRDRARSSRAAAARSSSPTPCARRRRGRRSTACSRTSPATTPARRSAC